MSEQPLYAADATMSPDRQLLIDATLREVATAGSCELPLKRLAKAAGVSPRVARRSFGDAESLILETAVSVARRSLVAGESNGSSSPFEHFEILASALMDQFGRYRPFYRALLSGPLASRANVRLDELVRPMNQLMVDQVSGPSASAAVRAETAEFFTARSRQIVTNWLLDPLTTETAEDIKPRLRRIVEVLGKPQTDGTTGVE